MKYLMTLLAVALMAGPVAAAEDGFMGQGGHLLLPPEIGGQPGSNLGLDDVPAWAQYKYFPYDIWERSLTHVGPDTGMKDPFWQYGPTFNPDGSGWGGLPKAEDFSGFLGGES